MIAGNAPEFARKRDQPTPNYLPVDLHPLKFPTKGRCAWVLCIPAAYDEKWCNVGRLVSSGSLRGGEAGRKLTVNKEQEEEHDGQVAIPSAGASASSRLRGERP